MFFRRASGFTLIEILVVIVILGILAALIVPRVMDRPDQARVVAARSDIAAIIGALKLYRLDNGAYPSSEQGLAALVSKPERGEIPRNWKAGGYLEKLPVDPWGLEYQYLNPGIRGEVEQFVFDLVGCFLDRQLAAVVHSDYARRLVELRVPGLPTRVIPHYSIGSGPDHVFKTPLPRGSSGFTIYVEGDVGNHTNWSRMGVIQGMIASGHPDFVLTVGDLTYANPAGQAAVDRHFNDIMVWSQDVADMPAWGNHEWTSTSDDLRNYKGRFDFPNSQTSVGSPSVSCCGEDWYWFDYGNVRFIAYPEEWSGAWSDWNTKVKPIMDQAQSDPKITFIVTFGHKPAYSSGYHAGSSTLKSIMDALGASHSKYVMNLNGHSHNYERSYPQSGVTHITAAPGGTNLEEASTTCLWSGGCPAPSWSAYRAMHHNAVKIHFTATGIEGTVYCGPVGDTGSNKNDITCTQGTVIDSWVIGSATPIASAPANAVTEASGGPAEKVLAERPAGAVPKAFSLSPNHPNPFRTTTEFQYALPEGARVEMSLYSVQGTRVQVLVDGIRGVGVQSVRVDGRALKPGVYFLRFRATSMTDASRRFTQTEKIQVLR